jgi:hypothetical protein
MTDREKVIKGLECIAGYIVFCANCKYSDVNGSGRGDRCKRDCAKDAIALLKAQEPVEPIIDTHWETPSVYENDVKVTENKCGACGAGIDKWDKYCRVCGRKVKWE